MVGRDDVMGHEQQCVKGVYLRVDTKPFVRTTTKPKGIDAYRVMKNFQEAAPRPFPAAKAPAGFAVKMTTVVAKRDSGERKVKGAMCTGPAKVTASWPGPDEDLAFALKPRKTTWLRTTPALARIQGKATNPIGIVETHDAYFLGCSELVYHAEDFGHGLWGFRRTLENPTWTIYLEDKPLGTFAGEGLRLAPN